MKSLSGLVSQDECFELGYVLKSVGHKGDVQCILDCDDPKQYSKLESVFVKVNEQLVPFFIEQIEIQAQQKCRIKFNGLNTQEDANGLIGFSLWLPLNLLPPLGDKQFYYHEVIGYTAADKQLGELGQIINVMENGAHPIFLIETPQGKEMLVPAVDAFLCKVNRASQCIELDLPEGFSDI